MATPVLSVPVWVAGYQMPGYSPETPYVYFGGQQWQQAHGYLHDEVQRFWDQDQQAAVPERESDTDDDPQVDGKWLPVDTALGLATHNQAFVTYTGDGRMVFVVEPKTLAMSVDGLDTLFSEWDDEWFDYMADFPWRTTDGDELRSLARWRDAISAVQSYLNMLMDPTNRFMDTIKVKQARVALLQYMDLISAKAAEMLNDEKELDQ